MNSLTLVESPQTPLPAPPYALHLGCGEHRVMRVDVPHDCTVIRFDRDPNCQPDVLGDVRTDLAQFPDGSARLIHMSHLLEHVHRYEATLVLAECRRLLMPTGELLIWVPDGQRIGEELADGRAEDIAYQTQEGRGIKGITPLDMLYGMQSEVARGNQGMIHHCVYTKRSLQRALEDAGFPDMVLVREGWELKAKAFASVRPMEWGN